jgi:hypothetical protein
VRSTRSCGGCATISVLPWNAGRTKGRSRGGQLIARGLLLGRAALAGTGRGRATALAYLGQQVTARVRALQGTRPESRHGAAALAASLVMVSALALADATSALGRFLEILHP